MHPLKDQRKGVKYGRGVKYGITPENAEKNIALLIVHSLVLLGSAVLLPNKPKVQVRSGS